MANVSICDQCHYLRVNIRYETNIKPAPAIPYSEITNEMGNLLSSAVETVILDSQVFYFLNRAPKKTNHSTSNKLSDLKFTAHYLNSSLNLSYSHILRSTKPTILTVIAVFLSNYKKLCLIRM